VERRASAKKSVVRQKLCQKEDRAATRNGVIFMKSAAARGGERKGGGPGTTKRVLKLRKEGGNPFLDERGKRCSEFSEFLGGQRGPRSSGERQKRGRREENKRKSPFNSRDRLKSEAERGRERHPDKKKSKKASKTSAPGRRKRRPRSKKKQDISPYQEGGLRDKKNLHVEGDAHQGTSPSGVRVKTSLL